MIVFFLPIFLAPYWAYLARTGAINAHDFGHRNPSCQNGNQFCDGLFEQTDFASQKWSAYFSACVCALIFGSLQVLPLSTIVILLHGSLSSVRCLWCGREGSRVFE